jgi:hypothetical protein
MQVVDNEDLNLTKKSFKSISPRSKLNSRNIDRTPSIPKTIGDDSMTDQNVKKQILML